MPTKNKINSKQYLTNVKITREYNVSAATVSRWMRLALEGKNNLEVKSTENRYFVRDNQHNHAELSRLARKGRKHRGTASYRKVSPTDAFSKTFTDQQKYELIRALMVDNEIPFKFARLGEGAKIWAKMQEKGNKENTLRAGKIDIDMLENSAADIMNSLEKDTVVNVIEIGTGNFAAGTNLIQTLSKKLIVSDYLSISYSSRLLDLQKKYFMSEYKDHEKVAYTQEAMDIERLILDKFTVSLKQKNKKSVNILLLLGASLFNYSDYTSILHNLRKALFPEDFLIISNSILSDDTKLMNKAVQSNFGSQLLLKLPEILGLDTSANRLKYHFDEETNTKRLYYIADREYDIHFESGQEVHIRKDQKITLMKQELSIPIRFYQTMEEHGYSLLNSRIDYSLDWFQSTFAAYGFRSNYL